MHAHSHYTITVKVSSIVNLLLWSIVKLTLITVGYYISL